MFMKLTPHNTEQACRGYAMYELAKRGYVVQFTDSRFPKEDLLVVSPKGFHFGIDIKGQSTKNFWLVKQPNISPQFFYFLIYLEPTKPKVFILPSSDMFRLWHEYKDRITAKKPTNVSDNIWGINWTTPNPFLDNWECLPT